MKLDLGFCNPSLAQSQLFSDIWMPLRHLIPNLDATDSALIQTAIWHKASGNKETHLFLYAMLNLLMDDPRDHLVYDRL